MDSFSSPQRDWPESEDASYKKTKKKKKKYEKDGGDLYK